jgi:glycosyltransferase involved in cell wall biosynthesis
MSKFIVMLRVKDGLPFLAEWLSRYAILADEIVALDNGSTDGTFEALKTHPKVVKVIRTEGYNEGRDKNLLYAHVRTRKPDWCLWVDVDEILEPCVRRADIERLMGRKFVSKYAFRRFHFIDREHFAGSWFRLNYSSGHDRVMWREAPTGYFEDLILDSPNIKGITGLKVNTSFRIKHLGYINQDLVDKKALLYRALISPDKAPALSKMYLHNERPIRWHDDPRHPKVILINGLLNMLQFKNLILRANSKGWQLMQEQFERIMFRREII